MKLIYKDTNPKTIKSLKMFGHTIYTHTMHPHIGVCPFSKHCFETCLVNSGMGQCGNVKRSRMNKTEDYLQDKAAYKLRLVKELQRVPANISTWTRLNTMSDVNWHDVIELLPNHNFYDYTKDIKKFMANDRPNYHLTFSYDGHNWGKCKRALTKGSVSVVFNQLPKNYKGYKVIDGDTHDSRYLDPKGVIVGLKFKGSKARLQQGIENGFVVNN